MDKAQLLERLQVLESRARSMRRHPTPAEKRLKALLNKHFPSIKFLYQVVIMPYYIVDVLCPGAALIIEADGESHAFHAAKDAQRSDYLRARGYQVMRLSNALIFEKSTRVAFVIRRTLLSQLRRS